MALIKELQYQVSIVDKVSAELNKIKDVVGQLENRTIELNASGDATTKVNLIKDQLDTIPKDKIVEINASGDATEQVNKVKGQLDTIPKEVNTVANVETSGAEAGVKRLGGLINGLKSAVSGIAMGAAMGIGFGAFTQIGDILQTGTQRAQDDAKAVRVLGNEYHLTKDQANTYLDTLKSIRDNSNIDTSTIEQAAEKFGAMNMPAAESSTLIKSVGDAMAMTGGSAANFTTVTNALSQGWEKQAFTGRQLMSMMKAGIPIYDIMRNQLHMSNKEIQDATKATNASSDQTVITFGKLGPALEKYGEQGAGMAGATQTMGAQMAKFKDQLSDVAALFMGPALSFFSGKVMPELRASLTGAMPEMRAFAQYVVQLAGNMMGPLTLGFHVAEAALHAIMPVISELATIFSHLPSGIQLGIVALGAFILLLPKIVSLTRDVSSGVKLVQTSINLLGSVAKQVVQGDIVQGFSHLKDVMTGNAKAADALKASQAELNTAQDAGKISQEGLAVSETATSASEGEAVIATEAVTAANTEAAASTGIFSGAMGVLDAVMDANPIMLVVLAIGALTAAFVIAYEKCPPFRDFVNGLGKDLEGLMGFLQPVIDGVQKLIGIIASNPAVMDFIKGAETVGGAAGNVLSSVGLSTGGYVDKNGVHHFAKGGPTGPDTIPALLSPGEMVLTAQQQASFKGGVGGQRVEPEKNILTQTLAPTGMTMYGEMYQLHHEFSDFVSGVKLPEMAAKGAMVQKFATGGTVANTTGTDTVPAQLSPGETVTPAGATAPTAGITTQSGQQGTTLDDVKREEDLGNQTATKLFDAITAFIDGQTTTDMVNAIVTSVSGLASTLTSGLSSLATGITGVSNQIANMATNTTSQLNSLSTQMAAIKGAGAATTGSTAGTTGSTTTTPAATSTPSANSTDSGSSGSGTSGGSTTGSTCANGSCPVVSTTTPASTSSTITPSASTTTPASTTGSTVIDSTGAVQNTSTMNPVTVLMQPGCDACSQLESDLSAAGIPYNTIDVTSAAGSQYAGLASTPGLIIPGTSGVLDTGSTAELAAAKQYAASNPTKVAAATPTTATAAQAASIATGNSMPGNTNMTVYTPSVGGAAPSASDQAIASAYEAATGVHVCLPGESCPVGVPHTDLATAQTWYQNTYGGGGAGVTTTSTGVTVPQPAAGQPVTMPSNTPPLFQAGYTVSGTSAQAPATFTSSQTQLYQMTLANPAWWPTSNADYIAKMQETAGNPDMQAAITAAAQQHPWSGQDLNAPWSTTSTGPITTNQGPQSLLDRVLSGNDFPSVTSTPAVYPPLTSNDQVAAYLAAHPVTSAQAASTSSISSGTMAGTPTQSGGAWGALSAIPSAIASLFAAKPASTPAVYPPLTSNDQTAAYLAAHPDTTSSNAQVAAYLAAHPVPKGASTTNPLSLPTTVNTGGITTAEASGLGNQNPFAGLTAINTGYVKAYDQGKTINSTLGDLSKNVDPTQTKLLADLKLGTDQYNDLVIQNTNEIVATNQSMQKMTAAQLALNTQNAQAYAAQIAGYQASVNQYETANNLAQTSPSAADQAALVSNIPYAAGGVSSPAGTPAANAEDASAAWNQAHGVSNAPKAAGTPLPLGGVASHAGGFAKFHTGSYTPLGFGGEMKNDEMLAVLQRGERIFSPEDTEELDRTVQRKQAVASANSAWAKRGEMTRLGGGGVQINHAINVYGGDQSAIDKLIQYLDSDEYYEKLQASLGPITTSIVNKSWNDNMYANAVR